MKINFSFWKKESNCMKVRKYSDQTMWKWGGFFCIISSNIWYSLPEWISYFLLGLRFPTFSASVTQEFIRPRTIKICWTWSCFCFFLFGHFCTYFWNLCFILMNLIEVSLTFGTKLLLPLVLKKCNSVQVVTCNSFFARYWKLSFMAMVSRNLAATRTRTTDTPARTDSTIPAASYLFDQRKITRSSPYTVLPCVK